MGALLCDITPHGPGILRYEPAVPQPLRINERLIIPAGELSWSAARASGPGGQNVNKVASKVELRFDLRHTQSLDWGTRTRLQALCPQRIDQEGRLLVVSQLTRDQVRNLEDARRKLAALIAQALKVPKRRKKTKPSRAAREERLSSKHRASEKKRARSKPRRDDW